MTQTFKKTKENFTCEQCGQHVVGDGYTNHCPYCLWSKHVDIHPGDRAAQCGGLMMPAIDSVKGSKYILKHTCVVCKHTKVNKTHDHDNFDQLIALQ